jgi:hypothetical protein
MIKVEGLYLVAKNYELIILGFPKICMSNKATPHQSPELVLEKNKQLVRNFIEDIL